MTKFLRGGIEKGADQFFHFLCRPVKVTIFFNGRAGIAEGIEDGVPDALQDVNAAMSQLNAGVKASINPVINTSANTSPLIINIENFNNNSDTDIQALAEKLEYYRRNAALSIGGEF